MAAGSLILYSANKDDLRIQDLATATVKMALLASTYTPNYGTGGDDVLADVSAHEIAAGNGYTAGGFTLTGKTITAITNGFRFNSANPSWLASGSGLPVWRYGLLYVSGSLWGMTSPLIGSFLGDATPTDVPITPAGETLQIVCPAAGWFDIL